MICDSLGIGTDQRSLLCRVLFISGNIFCLLVFYLSAFNVLLLHCILYRNNYIYIYISLVYNYILIYTM